MHYFSSRDQGRDAEYNEADLAAERKLSGEIFDKLDEIDEYSGDFDASSQEGLMEVFQGNCLIFYNKIMMKSFILQENLS